MSTLLLGSSALAFSHGMPQPVDAAARQKHLKITMRNALLGAVHTPLFTPGFFKRWTPAVDVIGDDFSGKDGNAVLAELLAIVGKAARTGNADAAAWIDARAEAYAQWHLADVLADEAGEVL